MLNKDIRSLFPPDFAYWKTSWYRQLSKERNRFRFNVLVIAYMIAIVIPVALLIQNLVSGNTALLLNYTIPLVCMIGLMVYLLAKRNVKTMAPISLAVCAVGFYCSVLLPGGQAVYFLMFFAFPQLTILLIGIRRGKFWAIGFLASAVLLFLFKETGIIRDWQITLDSNQLMVCALAYLLLFSIAVTTNKMYQKHLIRTVRGLILDDETDLLVKNVLKLCLQPDQTYVLSIFRILNFSELISIFGHNLSTPVLRFASRQLFSLIRDTNYQVFRLSGPEFALLAPVENATKQKCVFQKLELVQNQIQKAPLCWESHEIHLIYQASAALIKPQDQGMALKYADEALKSMEKGDQRLAVFDSHTRPFSNKPAEQYQALINNKKHNSFRAFYQPIVNNQSGKIEWLESLMRVHLGEQQYDSIHPYMDVARSTGLYPDITRFMLDNAARILPTIPYDLSINITITDIQNPSFLAHACSVCEAVAGYPNTLIFEIIESDELSELQTLKRFIEMVHLHGCKVAIDDFGSGYSNFANLADLDIDIVKIDGSLVKKSGDDKKALAIIETIQKLCARTGYKTVAEYVESQSLLYAVKCLNIDYSQGYLISRPVDTASSFH